MKNKIIIAIVGALLGAGIYAAFFASEPTISAVSTSTTATFSTSKIAETGFAPSSASATSSTSLYNSDSTDRVIINAFAYCNGLDTSKVYLTGGPLANLIFTLGTTSNTANSSIATAANKFTLTVATTTPSGIYVSTTTTPFPDDSTRLWASGTYLLINANATNTAACVAGVHYLAS